jgi:RNA polymerase sigma factor (sigma-70 family)
MKLTDPDPALLRATTEGDLKALDRLLRQLQPGVFNLAVRFLGNREDGADAAQEILLKVVTHLGSFRGEARFSTWVWRIAHHHLLNAATRSREAPALSLEAMAERLGQGLDYFAQSQSQAPRTLTPEDKLEARQTALGCTQQMLMTLDRDQRLAYLVDLLLDVDSETAGDILGISGAAYRQRLSRARSKLDGFTRTTCGLANKAAACRCERQQPGLAALAASGAPQPIKLRALHPDELRQSEQRLDALIAAADFAALARTHPDYLPHEGWAQAMMAVLEGVDPPSQRH